MVRARDKQRDVRTSIQQAAWIVLDGGFASRACTVVNLSTTGAKLRVSDPDAVHTKLRLVFSRDGRKGRACEVVWRRGTIMGVKFRR